MGEGLYWDLDDSNSRFGNGNQGPAFGAHGCPLGLPTHQMDIHGHQMHGHDGNGATTSLQKCLTHLKIGKKMRNWEKKVFI